MSPFNRRALLQTGALAAGAYAVLGAAAAEAAAPDSPATPESAGALLAWVILHPQDRAEIRLARQDGRGRIMDEGDPVILPASALSPDGRAASAWGQMRVAARRAQQIAVEQAARGWGVAPEACTVLQGRIAHRPTGRAIGYAVWVDTQA